MAATNLPRVPEGLRELVKNYTKGVLREKPNNLYDFSVDYFEKIASKAHEKKVVKYEPKQSYETIMNNRIRQQVPLSLAFHVIPESLTEVIKKFIKAVLKENPQYLILFAIEYFKNLQGSSSQTGKIQYSAYDKYIELNEGRSPPLKVTCTCGRIFSARDVRLKLINNSSVADQQPVKDNKSEQYIKAVYIIQKHFRHYLQRKAKKSTKVKLKTADSYNGPEVLNAILLIQRQFRRLLLNKKAEKKLEIKHQSMGSYDSVKHMGAALIIQRYVRAYLRRKRQPTTRNVKDSSVDRHVSLTTAAFVIQRAFRKMIRARKAKKHINAELEQCDEMNDNVSEAASYTSASTALLSTESTGDHEFGLTNYEEAVHQQTIKEDEEVENNNTNDHMALVNEAVKLNEISTKSNVKAKHINDNFNEISIKKPEAANIKQIYKGRNSQESITEGHKIKEISENDQMNDKLNFQNITAESNDSTDNKNIITTDFARKSSSQIESLKSSPESQENNNPTDENYESNLKRISDENTTKTSVEKEIISPTSSTATHILERQQGVRQSTSTNIKNTVLSETTDKPVNSNTVDQNTPESEPLTSANCIKENPAIGNRADENMNQILEEIKSPEFELITEDNIQDNSQNNKVNENLYSQNSSPDKKRTNLESEDNDSTDDNKIIATDSVTKSSSQIENLELLPQSQENTKHTDENIASNLKMTSDENSTKSSVEKDVMNPTSSTATNLLESQQGVGQSSSTIIKNTVSSETTDKPIYSNTEDQNPIVSELFTSADCINENIEIANKADENINKILEGVKSPEFVKVTKDANIRENSENDKVNDKPNYQDIPANNENVHIQAERKGLTDNNNIIVTDSVTQSSSQIESLEALAQSQENTNLTDENIESNLKMTSDENPTKASVEKEVMNPTSSTATNLLESQQGVGQSSSTNINDTVSSETTDKPIYSNTKDQNPAVLVPTASDDCINDNLEIGNKADENINKILEEVKSSNFEKVTKDDNTHESSENSGVDNNLYSQNITPNNERSKLQPEINDSIDNNNIIKTDSVIKSTSERESFESSPDSEDKTSPTNINVSTSLETTNDKDSVKTSVKNETRNPISPTNTQVLGQEERLNQITSTTGIPINFNTIDQNPIIVTALALSDCNNEKLIPENKSEISEYDKMNHKSKIQDITANNEKVHIQAEINDSTDNNNIISSVMKSTPQIESLEASAESQENTNLTDENIESNLKMTSDKNSTKTSVEKKVMDPTSPIHILEPQQSSSTIIKNTVSSETTDKTVNSNAVDQNPLLSQAFTSADCINENLATGNKSDDNINNILEDVKSPEFEKDTQDDKIQENSQNNKVNDNLYSQNSSPGKIRTNLESESNDSTDNNKIITTDSVTISSSQIEYLESSPQSQENSKLKDDNIALNLKRTSDENSTKASVEKEVVNLTSFTATNLLESQQGVGQYSSTIIKNTVSSETTDKPINSNTEAQNSSVSERLTSSDCINENLTIGNKADENINNILEGTKSPEFEKDTKDDRVQQNSQNNKVIDYLNSQNIPVNNENVRSQSESKDSTDNNNIITTDSVTKPSSQIESLKSSPESQENTSPTDENSASNLILMSDEKSTIGSEEKEVINPTSATGTHILELQQGVGQSISTNIKKTVSSETTDKPVNSNTVDQNSPESELLESADCINENLVIKNKSEESHRNEPLVGQNDQVVNLPSNSKNVNDIEGHNDELDNGITESSQGVQDLLNEPSVQKINNNFDNTMSPMVKDTCDTDITSVNPTDKIGDGVESGFHIPETESSLPLSNQLIGLPISTTNKIKKSSVVKEKQLLNSASGRLIQTPIAELQLKSFKTTDKEGSWFEVYNEPNALPNNTNKDDHTHALDNANLELRDTYSSNNLERTASFINGDQVEYNDPVKHKQSISFFISFDENDKRTKFKIPKKFLRNLEYNVDAHKPPSKYNTDYHKNKVSQAEEKFENSGTDVSYQESVPLKLQTIHELNENEIISDIGVNLDNSTCNNQSDIKEKNKNNLSETQIVVSPAKDNTEDELIFVSNEINLLNQNKENVKSSEEIKYVNSANIIKRAYKNYKAFRLQDKTITVKDIKKEKSSISNEDKESQQSEWNAAIKIQRAFRTFVKKRTNTEIQTHPKYTKAKILAAIRIQKVFRDYIQRKKAAKSEWFLGTQLIEVSPSQPALKYTEGRADESANNTHNEFSNLDAQSNGSLELATDIGNTINELYSTKVFENDNGVSNNLAGSTNKEDSNLVKDSEAEKAFEDEAARKGVTQSARMREVMNDFLVREINFSSEGRPFSQILNSEVDKGPDEVHEIECVKKTVSLTNINEVNSEDVEEKERQDDLHDNNESISDLDTLDSTTLKLSKTDEIIEKMSQRRSSELREMHEKEDYHITDPMFDEPVVSSMSYLQQQSPLDNDDDYIEDDDIIVNNRLQREETRESSAQSESVVFGNAEDDKPITNEAERKIQLSRHYTIAGDDPNSIFQSVIIHEESENGTNGPNSSSFCLDDETSENIRKKIMAYSLSEADSDYYDTNKLVKDDFHIDTAMADALDTSTETESTIVSAAAKIQAGARGFLTRRRLRRASAGTKSSTQETKASFGNEAISESLERFIEEEAAKKIQAAYRLHSKKTKKQNITLKSASLESSLAAKRQTLQRGDALQNDSNSTPEDEIADSNTGRQPQKMKHNSESKNGGLSIKKKDMRLNWPVLRQNSMPVQIDCEVLRVIPKHKRRRIKSAQNENQKIRK